MKKVIIKLGLMGIILFNLLFLLIARIQAVILYVISIKNDISIDYKYFILQIILLLVMIVSWIILLAKHKDLFNNEKNKGLVIFASIVFILNISYTLISDVVSYKEFIKIYNSYGEIQYYYERNLFVFVSNCIHFIIKLVFGVLAIAFSNEKFEQPKKEIIMDTNSKCPFCGNEINEEDVFCQVCGAKNIKIKKTI